MLMFYKSYLTNKAVHLFFFYTVTYCIEKMIVTTQLIDVCPSLYLMNTINIIDKKLLGKWGSSVRAAAHFPCSPWWCLWSGQSHTTTDLLLGLLFMSLQCKVLKSSDFAHLEVSFEIAPYFAKV